MSLCISQNTQLYNTNRETQWKLRTIVNNVLMFINCNKCATLTPRVNTGKAAEGSGWGGTRMEFHLPNELFGKSRNAKKKIMIIESINHLKGAKI